MRKFVVFIFFLSINSPIFSQVAQWRGEHRDGKFPDTGLLKEWPEDGPEMVLEVDSIGVGYSSPVVMGNTIYITGRIDTLDYLSAIDFQGNIKWQVPYGRSWIKSFSDTRSSPTVEGNRVYVLGGVGRLVCLNTENGEEIWAVNVDKDFEAEWHVWGVSESILIVDDKVICTPGGKKTSVVAFDKMTGEPVWQSECVGGQRSYASPTIYEYNGLRFILAMTASHLIALKPETGEVAWSYKYLDPDEWTYDTGLIWTNTPLFKDDGIFITKGYNYKSVMLKMDSAGTSVTEKFVDHTLDNHHHGVVLVDGYIYGSNWISNGKGKWVCMKWDTGEIMYVDDWHNKGSIIYADGMLYTYVEKSGHVGLIKPGHNKFEVVSSFQIKKGRGPHWTYPFIADGKLFIRHGDILMAYNIKA
ncbi:MAG: PQQ-binding-like beta-propeller repeat protein [Chlorobi bacterium]|nr:PQQ-binding-like beta-propeller repeat protein [Chlorobiota bacterium]